MVVVMDEKDEEVVVVLQLQQTQRGTRLGDVWLYSSAACGLSLLPADAGRTPAVSIGAEHAGAAGRYVPAHTAYIRGHASPIPIPIQIDAGWLHAMSEHCAGPRRWSPGARRG